jgi:hypothetical protein
MYCVLSQERSRLDTCFLHAFRLFSAGTRSSAGRGVASRSRVLVQGETPPATGQVSPALASPVAPGAMCSYVRTNKWGPAMSCLER